MQVALGELAATAGHWQGVGTQLTAMTPPTPDPPVQPTTAAISIVNAAVGTATASLVARTQATADALVNAAEGYGNQEATNATDMTGVTQGVTVV